MINYRVVHKLHRSYKCEKVLHKKIVERYLTRVGRIALLGARSNFALKLDDNAVDVSFSEVMTNLKWF
jgi:hypothetical protein